jgi:hypothetical protein
LVVGGVEAAGLVMVLVLLLDAERVVLTMFAEVFTVGGRVVGPSLTGNVDGEDEGPRVAFPGSVVTMLAVILVFGRTVVGLAAVTFDAVVELELAGLMVVLWLPGALAEKLQSREEKLAGPATRTLEIVPK